LELALGVPGGVWCIACLRNNAEAEPNVDEEPDLSQTRTVIGTVVHERQQKIAHPAEQCTDSGAVVNTR